MIVDCIYKLHPNGEIIFGSFDTVKSQIVEFPDYFVGKLESPELRWYQANYDEGSPGHLSLTPYAMVFKDALLIVEYDNIGIVLVYPDRFELLLFIDDMVTQVLGIFDGNPFTYQGIPIGIAKSKCYNKNAPHIITYIIESKTRGGLSVNRRTQGTYEIDIKNLDYDFKTSSKLWLEIHDNLDYVGYVTVNGQCVPVGIVNGRLVIME